MNLDAIFFDLGMVMVTFDWNVAIPQFAAMNGGDTARVKRFLAHPAHEAFERGGISEDEFYIIGCAEMGFLGSASEMIKTWNEIFQEIPETVQLVRELANRIPLYTISNTNLWHAEYLESHYDWMHLFTRRFYSYTFGIRKPAPRIYKLACTSAEVVPERALFVDDRIENVLGAREAGMMAIHASTPGALANEINTLFLERQVSMNTAFPKIEL